MIDSLIYYSASEQLAAEECGAKAAHGWREEGPEAEEGTRMDAHVMSYLATGETPDGDGPAGRARDVIAAGVLPDHERIISIKAAGFPRRMRAWKEYGPGDRRIIAFASLDDTFGNTGEPEMVALGEEPNTLEIPDLKDGNIRDKWKLFVQGANYAWLAFEAWPRTLKVIFRPIFSRFLDTPLRPIAFLASEKEQLREFLIERCWATRAALLAAKPKRSDFCHNCTGRHECDIYRADVTTTPRAVVAVTMPEKLAAITELARIEKSVKKMREEFEAEVDALVAGTPHRFAGKEYGYEEKPGNKEHDAEAAARIMHERGATADLFGKCFKVYVKGLTEHYKPLDPEGFKLIEAAKKPGAPKRVWYEREIPDLIEPAGLPVPAQGSPGDPSELSRRAGVIAAPPEAGPNPVQTSPAVSLVAPQDGNSRLASRAAAGDPTIPDPAGVESGPALAGEGDTPLVVQDGRYSNRLSPAEQRTDVAGFTPSEDAGSMPVQGGQAFDHQAAEERAQREAAGDDVRPHCQKVQHVSTGYLHPADDDGPYDIDGVSYCGRCHVALPHADPPDPEPEKKTRAPRRSKIDCPHCGGTARPNRTDRLLWDCAKCGPVAPGQDEKRHRAALIAKVAERGEMSIEALSRETTARLEEMSKS